MALSEILVDFTYIASTYPHPHLWADTIGYLASKLELSCGVVWTFGRT